MPLSISEISRSADPDRANHRSTVPRSGWRKTCALLFAIGVVVAGVGTLLLARTWPFSRPELKRSLEGDLQGKVRFDSFHKTYFPRPGCVAENVVVQHESGATLTIPRLIVEGSYLGLLHRYVPRVIAERAELIIPEEALGQVFENQDSHGSARTVGEVRADGSRIDILAAKDGQPLTFQFDSFTLGPIAGQSRMTLAAKLRLPQHLGELQVHSSIGPTSKVAGSQVPLSGSYSLREADLGEFSGVGGILASDGKFSGPLGAVAVDGVTDTPEFRADPGLHPVHLQTKFHAIVNGTNGDVVLDPVESRWGKTTVVARGSIAQAQNMDGKLVLLELASSSATVEDLLYLFVHEERSPMTGSIEFRAKARLIPGDQAFYRRLTLQGEFAIANGRYSNPQTQRQIDLLSARAQGKADKMEDDAERDQAEGTQTLERDLPNVFAAFGSRVVLRNGMANLSSLYFNVPGAAGSGAGTYNLRTRFIDAQGIVHLQSQLSETTTGPKSFLLKIVQPFTRHNSNGKGATVSVHMTGKYGHPSFSVRPMKGGQ